MDKDPAADAEIAERRDRAVVAAHAHVPHAPPGFAADAEPDHFVVAPQGAIEEDQRAPRRVGGGARSVIAAQPGIKRRIFRSLCR